MITWKKDVIGNMISVELRGRLGNQLFQYAVCRIMSEKLDCDFSISDEWLGKNILGQAESPINTENSQVLPWLDEDTE